MFQMVTMEDLVPDNHLLRKLKQVLNLQSVVDKVSDRYSKLGRSSYDPEVVVKIWVIQYLYGFSERQVCDEINMHAGYRWFCGLSFNDPVPDQSTLVKLRNSKWAGTEFWQELLDETVRACEAAGICKPDRMGVDGTQITASAATVSLEEIPPVLTLEEEPTATPTAVENPVQPTPQLTIETGGKPKGKHISGDPEWHGEKFSNTTHRSTTDPEARLYRKSSNCEAKLRYLGHYLAHMQSGVIYGAMATQASGTAEREAACRLLDRLPKKPDCLAMDLGYRDGGFLADILERGVQPLVPLGGEPLEEVKVYKRRTYNITRELQRQAVCRAAQARNKTREASRGRRGAIAQRQRTRLEHLYAEAKNNHGLARAHGRGLVKVDQQIKMTAAVQNLKRLLQTRPKGRAAAAIYAVNPISHLYMSIFKADFAHRDS